MVGMGKFNRNPNHFQHVSFLLKYLTFYSDSETSVGITLYEDMMNSAFAACSTVPPPHTWPVPDQVAGRKDK